MHYIQGYFNKKEEIPINPKFKSMSHEELLMTMNTLKDANNNMKNSLNAFTEENKELKNLVLNKPEKSSEFKNIYKDIKTTFFSSNTSNEEDIKENMKEIKDFLYDQYLLYGGLEEDEINDLNQLQIKEDNCSDNQDFFIFKQKIIERNYQELFRNIIASSELHNLYGIKTDDNIEPNDFYNNNANENNNNINELKNNDIKENNKKEDESEEKIKEIKMETVADKINSGEKKKKKNSNKKEKKDKGIEKVIYIWKRI